MSEPPSKATGTNRYQALIARIFESHYGPGDEEVRFARDALVTAAAELGIDLPKNLGDILYSFRYRNPLPESIQQHADQGREWIIEGVGRAQYRFKLTRLSRIVPRENMVAIKIPDSTPEITVAYALSDEQALLTKIRYNRLIDIFLGITAYSLQNHLRTTVKKVGQIEIDEIYVGLDRRGCQYVIPVQAKGGQDQHGVVQTYQDVRCCSEKFPQLICRPVSAQFLSANKIAMFELTVQNDEVRVIEERHYELVFANEISAGDLQAYSRQRSGTL